MAFKPEKVQEFLEVFYQSKNKIANFPGCLALALYRDVDFDNVFYTVSLWRNTNDLENYRNSELFQKTWLQTKVLFNEKPLAFSLKLQDNIKPFEE